MAGTIRHGSPDPSDAHIRQPLRPPIGPRSPRPSPTPRPYHPASSLPSFQPSSRLSRAHPFNPSPPPCPTSTGGGSSRMGGRPGEVFRAIIPLREITTLPLFVRLPSPKSRQKQTKFPGIITALLPGNWISTCCLRSLLTFGTKGPRVRGVILGACQ